MEVNVKDLESPKEKGKKEEKKSKKPFEVYEKPPNQPKQHHPVMSEIPDELKNGVKDIVVNTLSLGGRHNSAYLKFRLKNSKFINQYLDNYMLLDKIGFLNDHAKFALSYGMLLFEANTAPLLIQVNPETKK